MDLTIPMMILAGLVAGRGKPAEPSKRGPGMGIPGGPGSLTGGGGGGAAPTTPTSGGRPTMGFGGLDLLTGRRGADTFNPHPLIPDTKTGIDGAQWGSEAGDNGGGDGDMGGA